MTVHYRIDVRNKDTGEEHRVEDFDWFECLSVVNGIGFLKWQYSGDKAVENWVKNLPVRSTMELWRKDTAMTTGWYRYWSGHILDRFFKQGQFGSLAFTAFHDNVWLANRIVNWAASTTNRSKFSSVVPETIAKTIVEYNLGASATTGNGRKRTGTITGISVASDLARGVATDWYCFGDNVMATLQELGLKSGFDFNLNKTSDTTYQFEYYPNTFGTDRRTTVTIGMGRGNLESAQYNVVRSEEKTVACVWGAGEDAGRDYTTVNGPTYASDNDVELFVDARNVAEGDTAGLTAKGEARINESIYTESFELVVAQAPSSRFQQHYFLGDIVSAINPANGEKLVRKIQSASIVLKKGGLEEIDIGLSIPASEL